MSKKYFYGYDKLNFDPKYEQISIDFYDRASSTKDLWWQEYNANRALRKGGKKGHEIAVKETVAYFKQDKRFGFVSTESFLLDEDGNSCSDVPLDLIDFNSEWVPDFYAQSEEPVMTKKELEKQKTINCLLYDTLRCLADESQYMRETIAQYLYDSHYNEVLSDYQMEFWAADFAMFALWEEQGRNTAKTLYLSWDNGCTENTKRWQHHDMWNRIKAALAEFRPSYNLPCEHKRAARARPKKTMIVEPDYDEEDILEDDYEFAVA